MNTAYMKTTLHQITTNKSKLIYMCTLRIHSMFDISNTCSHSNSFCFSQHTHAHTQLNRLQVQKHAKVIPTPFNERKPYTIPIYKILLYILSVRCMRETCHYIMCYYILVCCLLKINIEETSEIQPTEPHTEQQKLNK